MSPDGRIVAFALLKDKFDQDGNRNWFGRIMLMETATGKLLHQFDIDESFGQVAFSTDGKLLAAGGLWTVRVWDVKTGTEACRFEGHQNQVTSLVFSPDGKRLASSSDDSTVLVWDVANEKRAVSRPPVWPWKGNTVLAAWLTFWLLGLPASGAQAESPQTLAQQITTIQAEYEQRERQFYNELRAAAHDNAKVHEANNTWRTFVRSQAAKLKALIRAKPDDPSAFDGILLLAGVLRWPLDDDLVQMVLGQHRDHPKMGQLCFDLRGRGTEAWAERILRSAAERHPLPAVRGQALYALADYYRYRALPFKGPEPADARRWLTEAERCYTETAKNFADVLRPDGKAKLGDLAAAELARLRNLPNLNVGKLAPEISGEDLDGRPFKLSDYRGKVVLLDFWGHW